MASYIDRSLGAGETVIVRARFHWLYSLGAWLRLLVPLALAAGAMVYARQDETHAALGGTLAVAFLVLAVIGLWAFLGLMIRKWTTELGVTSHRFVEKYGLFSMRTNEIALPNVEGVQVRQSMMGRLFDYGIVRIEGTGVDSVTTPNIADPVGFVRAIQTAKEHVAGLTATPRMAPYPIHTEPVPPPIQILPPERRD